MLYGVVSRNRRKFRETGFGAGPTTLRTYIAAKYSLSGQLIAMHASFTLSVLGIG
jgi:hypothetical protein